MLGCPGCAYILAIPGPNPWCHKALRAVTAETKTLLLAVGSQESSGWHRVLYRDLPYCSGYILGILAPIRDIYFLCDMSSEVRQSRRIAKRRVSFNDHRSAQHGAKLGAYQAPSTL